MLNHKITSEYVNASNPPDYSERSGWVHTCEWVLRGHGFLKLEMWGTLAMFNRMKELINRDLEKTEEGK